MTVADILRHDLTVVRRNGVGKLLVALSLGVTLGGVLVGYALSNGPLTGDSLVLSSWLVAGTVFPLGVLLTAAVSISADRESGRLRLLFGTPMTKSDLFVGVLLSRVVATCASLAAGFTITGLLAALLSVDVNATAYWALGGYTLLLCIVYTSAGIAIAAISPTRLRAVGVALAFYVWSAFWPQIVSQVAEPGGPRPGEPTSTETVAHFVGTLSPFGAYSQIVTPSRAIYAESVTGPLLATPTMLVILVVWSVVPGLVGFWWFSKIDL